VSALTKLFVVLLVICSLLLTAATVVYVNRSEDYVAALDRAKAETLREKEAARIARMDADAAAARERDLTAAANATRDKLAGQVTQLQQEASRLATELATAKTNIQIRDGQITSLTAAVKAGQTGGEGLFARNAELAKEIDKLRTERTELNTAVLDLTRRYDAMERELMFTKEKLAAAQGGAAGEVRGGPPANVRGTVTQVTSDRGQTFARIDLGSSDNIKAGDRLSILDQNNQQWLGEIIIESVQPEWSFGRLEGRNVTNVKPNHVVVSRL
jgi:hypothetical protein